MISDSPVNCLRKCKTWQIMLLLVGIGAPNYFWIWITADRQICGQSAAFWANLRMDNHSFQEIQRLISCLLFRKLLDRSLQSNMRLFWKILDFWEWSFQNCQSRKLWKKLLFFKSFFIFVDLFGENAEKDFVAFERTFETWSLRKTYCWRSSQTSLFRGIK